MSAETDAASFGGAPRVTLLTRIACHLCAPVRDVVGEVCRETGTQWAERDVDDDAEMRAEYGDQVPVVLVDGVVVASLRLEPDTLRRALNHAL